jgi:molecular chaperone GrpE
MEHRDEVETPADAEGIAPASAEPGLSGPELEQAYGQELEQAREEARSNWDRYVRAAAELENIRRRSAQELERVQKFALERFAGELLGVKDTLEMGLAAAESEPTIEALREGTEATLKLLGRVFEKFGITELDPRDAPFDPTVHEAISVQASPDASDERVLTVVQKGYVLNGRLLRPARVIVARPQGAKP